MRYWILRSFLLRIIRLWLQSPIVAEVTEDGLVAAIAKGTAVITATAADGSGVTRSCNITVSNNGFKVTDPSKMESDHNYPDACTDFWIYSIAGADNLKVTFDAQTKDGFDYLLVIDGNGNQVGKYTGTELAGKTIAVPGDTVKIQLQSDDSGNEWGFKVTKVTAAEQAEECKHPSVRLENKKDANCINTGYTGDKVCTVCEEVIEIGTSVPVTGHSWGNWIVSKPATYEESGLEIRSCAVCGLEDKRTIAQLIPADPDNPFVDVESARFYYNPVLWAVENGITNGTDATHFSPDDTCNRAQVVTFLWRAAGSPAPTSSNNPFTDVKEGSYYYKAVLWAVENGITNGTTATTFGTEEPCTRGQVATFLWRTLNKPEVSGTSNPFTDVESARFYYTPVLWAVEAGVTNGTTATTFEPEASCTRGQIVTFLYRAMA